MSLKAVHIVFISCSIALAFFLGAFLWHDYTATKDHTKEIISIASWATGGLLLIYAKAILRKLRQISFL